MHDDHWMEPKSFTEAREGKDIFCEFCGVEIPYHNVRCRLLKQAYKTRKAKCTFCSEEHQVGDQMEKHVVENHMSELAAMGVKRLTSRWKQPL